MNCLDIVLSLWLQTFLCQTDIFNGSVLKFLYSILFSGKEIVGESLVREEKKKEGRGKNFIVVSSLESPLSI